MQEEILNTVDIMIEKRFNQMFKSNYYIEATVKKINAGNTFNIEYQEAVIPNVKKRDSLTLSVGDVVLVCVVNGNFSNMFIDLKRP